MKISPVIISGQIKESSRAVVQNIKVHHCAVSRHQAGGGQYLKDRDTRTSNPVD